MSSPLRKFIEIQISVRADNPVLLEGLEAWLHLGLLSDEQLLQLGQQYLSQPLPPPPDTSVEIASSATVEESPSLTIPVAVDQGQSRRNLVNLPSRLWSSFQAEFSVRWLLFLGLFMVLVSSGVLVASRWQELPTIAQYGVLFAYTLGFFIATVWLGMNSSLPLTSQTLKWVTLLLIPLNFWAIDSLGLLDSITALFGAIAIIILTGITIIFNPISTARESPGISLQALLILNQLGLSYLQLGWRVPGFPLIAVYLGIIGTGFVTFCRRQEQEQISLNRLENLPLIFCLVPVAFLWWRAIFVVNLDVSQFGFALGLTGGLLSLYSEVILQPFAYLLLAAGWLVSIENQPEQALGVSSIALVIFGINLRQFWRKKDLAFIFAIGLQAFSLVWRLIPIESQQNIIEFSLQITQSPDNPWVLLGLVGLIYLGLMLALTNWIHQQQKPDLARFGDQISLGLGVILTAISLLDPVVRSLNLLASTLILVVYTIRRQSPRVFLVYLTHVTGLLTLASFIELFFPQLRLEQWGILSIVLMILEWLLYTIFTRSQTILIPHSILKSAWHMGLILAGLSYQFFYGNLTYNSASFCENFTCQGLSQWGIMWLITPIGLTSIARLIPQRRQLASQFSIIGAILLQLLVFRIPGIRLISWGVGTAVMILNTNHLQSQLSAILTVGFGLTFSGFLAWETIPDLTLARGLVVGAIALNLLWIGQAILNRLSNSITVLYAIAIESWTFLLCWVELIGLTGYVVGIYWQLLTPSIPITVATFISIIAVMIRLFNPPPSETEDSTFPFFVYIFGWQLELLMAHVLSFTDNALFNLSIANLILGLITQIVGDYWQHRNRIHHLSNPWQILPLFYGIFGAVLRSSGSFDNWTGTSLFILAFILIGVGRRSPELKPLTYMGIFGVSLAAYQLLFYNTYSAPTGEQLIAFAGLGTTIVYVYRLLSPQLIHYLHLSENEVKTIAHLHWAMSSCFLIASLSLPSELNSWLSLGIGIFLTRYAIFQGRYHSNAIEAEFWVYIGCLQAAAITYFISDILNLEGLLIPWSGAIASLIAYFIYFIPWDSWGWPLKPWRRVAMIIPVLTVVFTTIIAGSNLELSWYISVSLAIILYVILARFTGNIKLTYFSVGLINFAYYRWLLLTENNLNALGYGLLPGLSLLYFAQVDPSLQRPEQKLLRHWIRIFGIGMICVAALLTNQWTGILPGFISLIAIFIGLGLRIRAFLYVGTVTFLINAVNQLLILNSIYSFFKWIIGFIVGLVLIWIAANFETRREQMIATLQNWVSELEEWE